MTFLLVLFVVGLAAYFGYLFGVRRERGRRELIEQLQAQAMPRRGGVRLRQISVRR